MKKHVNVIGKFNMPWGLTIVITHDWQEDLPKVITDGKRDYKVLEILAGGKPDRLGVRVEEIRS